MNAKFLERFVKYRDIHRIELCKYIIHQKIENQFSIIHQRKAGLVYTSQLLQTTTIPAVLLIEARAAKQYWKIWSESVEDKISWQGRKPHREDVINKLLDIGYHFLSGRMVKICSDLNLPTELGIFHIANSSAAHPLAYDFIEWLRPFVVDRTLLHFLRKKKKPILTVSEKIISHFVSLLKKEFDKLHYHRHLKYCITLDYWVRLILLEFMKVVKSGAIYHPLFPSLRHESRCRKKPPRLPVAI